MKTHEFEIECIPPKTTAQAATRIFRNRATGKMFIGKNDKGRDVREGLMSLFAEHRPDDMFTTPVKLEIEWVYPYLKTIRKRDIGKMIPCQTRPDVDNLTKFTLEAISGSCFRISRSVDLPLPDFPVMPMIIKVGSIVPNVFCNTGSTLMSNDNCSVIFYLINFI